MTGLTNILAQIENDAKLRADSVKDEARIAAEKIIFDAKAEAEKIVCDFRQRAEDAAKEVIDRAKASDEIEVKRTELRKKQEIINKALDTAKSEIKNFDNDKYFDFLKSILKKNALKKQGTILLSQSDIETMTDGFKELLGQLNVEAKSGEISARNGFIIVYGNIEINCTIDALFDEKSEKISDALNRFLFGSKGGI